MIPLSHSNIPRRQGSTTSRVEVVSSLLKLRGRLGNKLGVHGSMVRPPWAALDDRDDLGEALVPAFCDRPPGTSRNRRRHLGGDGIVTGRKSLLPTSPAPRSKPRRRCR